MTEPTADPASNASKAEAVRRYGARVDFGKTSGDYARFRPGPPPSFYDRIDRAFGLGGMRAVDVGAGAGVAALELAARGAIVTALDISPGQIDAARKAAAERRISIDCRVAPAEATGLPAQRFDLYLALQCWHWFDPARAATEALRILKPGAVAIVASFDYLAGRSPVAARTEELILKHNPAWPMANGSGCHTRPLFDLPAAGFLPGEQFSYEHPQPFTHEAWRGRMRTCNGIGASLPPDQVARFDADLADLLTREFPAEPLTVVHRVWVVTATAPR